VTAMAS